MAKKARSSKAVRTTSAAKAAAKKPAATKAAPKKPAIKAAKKAAAKKPAASLAVLTTAQMEKVSSHFEAHLGKAEWVLHEHVSRKIHSDINEFQPSTKGPSAVVKIARHRLIPRVGSTSNISLPLFTSTLRTPSDSPPDQTRVSTLASPRPGTSRSDIES